MKILAVLQNQWFRKPEKVRALYAQYPERRNYLIKQFLFMGCTTGKRLRAAFGDLCDSIVWEEASPEIGGFAGSSFAADPDHIRRAIELHRPDVVLAFGAIARAGVDEVKPGVPIIYSPHPTAKYPDIMQRLKNAAAALRALGGAVS